VPIHDTLANAGLRAERELNRLGERMPEIKAPRMSFAEYLPQAMEHAQQDEKFARQLARALYEARNGG
jgi:hypothetical protein